MIKFIAENNIIRLDTLNTTYAMKIVRQKYVAHLYYGKKIDDPEKYYREQIVSFAPYPESEGPQFSLDTVLTELSFFGSGDLRDTALKIRNGNGDSVTFFAFADFKLLKSAEPIDGMPCSRNGGETLELIYRDEVSQCELHSYYTVFEESDTITRRIKLVNIGSQQLTVQTFFSCQLDFNEKNFNMLTLNGTYAVERHRQMVPLSVGRQSIYSQRGHSSHHHNPFVALVGKKTNENSGEAYGLLFVYSGNFEIQAEKLFTGQTRLLVGMNRNTFEWILDKGGALESPETLMTYSARGLNGMSQNLHDHIRNNIINPKFAFAPRPILINTWEAVYFNIDESVILKYAEKAKELGIDTLVVDDGWFGKRNNDNAGLGDWYVNKEKFPEGLDSLADKVRSYGLKFGIWIEPEMVNPDSELYRNHPDWVLQVKNRKSSHSRSQLVLDLANDEAVNYVADSIINTLKNVNPEYIKWDFNRSLSEVGSVSLPADRQGEVSHGFVLGSYKLHKKLTEAFPDALFEGCSGGGGRFDAAILYYCPQIWTSDQTDPVCRLPIQFGTATAYPLSAMGAHVSRSLSNCLEKNPDYGFRFGVALGGMTGYEFNITSLSKAEENEIRLQTETVKQYQPLLLSGDLYRCDGLYKNEYAYVVISKDKTEFLFNYVSLGRKRRKEIILNGLLEDAEYTDGHGRLFTGKELMEKGLPVNCNNQGKYAYEFCRFQIK